MVCWKNRPHRYNARLRPQPRTFFFISSLLFAKNLKIPRENCWMLWFPPNYFDYSFGQLLVFGPSVFFCFYFCSKWRRNGQKGGFRRSFGLSFDMITNRMKLKNNTPNALSSPYVDTSFFRKSENSWDIHHLAENDWFWPILTDFCRSSIFLFLVNSHAILRFSVKHIFFSRAQHWFLMSLRSRVWLYRLKKCTF